MWYDCLREVSSKRDCDWNLPTIWNLNRSISLIIFPNRIWLWNHFNICVIHKWITGFFEKEKVIFTPPWVNNITFDNVSDRWYHDRHFDNLSRINKQSTDKFWLCFPLWLSINLSQSPMTALFMATLTQMIKLHSQMFNFLVKAIKLHRIKDFDGHLSLNFKAHLFINIINLSTFLFWETIYFKLRTYQLPPVFLPCCCSAFCI